MTAWQGEGQGFEPLSPPFAVARSPIQRSAFIIVRARVVPARRR